MTLYFLSPPEFTGGPLAVHQAAVEVLRQGGAAKIIYTDKYFLRFGQAGLIEEGNRFVLKRHWRHRLRGIKRDPRLAQFAVPVADSFSRDDCFVVPEAMPQVAHWLWASGCRNVVIWWLSVDNFPMQQINSLASGRMLRRYRHLCQSHYAQRFVQARGATDVGMLSDVTQLSHDVPPVQFDKRGFDIAYLPAKSNGAEPVLAKLRETFSVVALENMSRLQIETTLCNTKIFLDFGHHPGKDRVPREAALCGCIPLLRQEGAACVSEDVDLPADLFIETPDFFAPERIATKVGQVLADADRLRPALQGYIDTIMEEHAIFKAEVSALCASDCAQT